MKLIHHLCFFLTMIASHAQSDEVRIVLFGGSSVATTYLPQEQKHHSLLQARLREAYPGQNIVVENWASGGEFIARYLMKGAYERQRADQPGIDVAIVRFGTNDQKRMEPDEYTAHLRRFLEILRQDYPGIRILLETGMYVDFPRHFSSNRNLSLQPYWEASRIIAREQGYPLVDYYAAVKRETDAGNWDTRIRARTSDEFILDASQDAGKENDPKWFTNFHPNAEGVRIAVDEEVKVLRETFPQALPTGQVAAKREPRNEEYYARHLNFSAERIEVSKEKNPDKELQEDTSAPRRPAGR